MELLGGSAAHEARTGGPVTTRRLLLLLAALAVFGLAYALYAHFLGWLDGLPVLPARYLDRASGEFRPPEQPITPTLELLKQAFGEHSPEVESLGYPTRLAFRRGETALVVACGRPPSQPDSHRVTVAPFSAAVFGKPKPPHLRQPDEVVEIATFHADKAVLEFDRIIRTPNDMNEARLVRLELISDPEAAVSPNDPRVGQVHITHNQRSRDPQRWLLLRTPGPVFYRDIRATGGGPVPGPDIWTDAAVEIVDCANLPRLPGRPAAWVTTPAAELRQSAAVVAVLTGQRLPPPTVTAIGLRVYLQPRPAAPSPGPAVNRSSERSAPFAGLRRVELLEQVKLHLWMEAGGAALLGSRLSPQFPSEIGPAGQATLGGLFAAHHHVWMHSRELLQVETRGPFLYDAEKNTARFEALPQVDPHLPNDVQVTRIVPGQGTQSLFTQVLELELENAKAEGGPASSPSGVRTTPVTSDRLPSTTTTVSTPAPAQRLRRLHAWTYTPGRVLTISSEVDQLHATGIDLVYEAAQQRTRLTGTPLIALQQRHVLTAGTANKPAEFIWEPDPTLAPAPAVSSDRRTSQSAQSSSSTRRNRLIIRGPGRVEMHDPEREGVVSASWQESLVHVADLATQPPLDMITLTGSARYEDPAAEYRLQAETLRLWVKSTAATTPRSELRSSPSPGPTPNRNLPTRIQALNRVQAHSAELVIEEAEQLNVLIRDVPLLETSSGNNGTVSAGNNRLQPGSPSAVAAVPAQAQAATRPAAASGHHAPHTGSVASQPAAASPRVPDRGSSGATTGRSDKKPPMKLRARTIDTWLVRGPEPPSGPPERNVPPLKPQPAPVSGPAHPGSPQPPTPANQPAYKYALERARCEGNVYVHQEPEQPAKERGTDIRASLLLIDHSAEGSILTVHGWDNRPAEIHHEGTSLIGPWIKIDQVHNLAVIEGRGSMALPAATDLAGNPLTKTEPVVIHFRDGMTFRGALKTAEFFGRVSVAQGDAGLTCHTMRVIFDRPVYFTSLRNARERATRSPGAVPTTSAPPPSGPPRSPAVSPTPPPGHPSEDSPRIESVHCYPCPADSAEHFRETLVYFHQVEREAATGRLIRQQQLEAQELTLLAQARDGDTGTPYRFLEAHGPGVVRIWGVGTSDLPSTGAASGSGTTSAAEMQLTIVHFSKRMIAKDKGRSYKEATFYDNVQVIHVPTDDPHLEIKRPDLPPRAVLLTCQSKLVVWTYRRGDEPPRQHMHAYGNAYLQSDEYAGSGEVIKNDGKLVTFEGSGAVPAMIRRRFRGDEQTAQRIIYDRATQQFTVEGSLGGAIYTPAPSTHTPSSPAKKNLSSVPPRP